MDRIVDVSNFQKNVDWHAVLDSGRAGGICKATEGLTFTDPFFAANWAALGALKAFRGAYCFARPGAAVAEAQADKFLQVVGSTVSTDILVLDLEVGDGDLSDFALRFLRRVHDRTGLNPWLYSYAPFIRAHLHDPRLAAYPLWLAAYQSTPPPAPPPWPRHMLWQHTNKAVVPGVTGLCDESLGDLAQIFPPPEPPEVVRPMYSPPIVMEPIVAELVPANGRGVWLFADSGAVYAWGGAPDKGNLKNSPDFVNRHVATAEVLGDGFRILDTAVPTEHYDFP